MSSSALGERPLGSTGDFAATVDSVPAWFAVIISQYANSPILLRLAANLAARIDPAKLFDQFYTGIRDIDTAQGYGLDVWGRIVGVSRVLQVPSGSFFGFSQASDAQPFDQAPFYAGIQLTNNFYLSDTAYRRLILAKALANVCDGSIASINQILINLFPGYGNCYVVDNGDMTMTYHFGSTLSPVDLAIAAQSGVLPRPAGVSASISQG